jgi:hypothetical protein
MKKYIVLGVLFLLPIVAYLFFASGINNFAKLPVLTENVNNVNTFESLTGESVTLTNKITILGFLGNDVSLKKAFAFNLNQKIYKRFYQFEDFQFVMVAPKETKEDVTVLKEEISQLTDANKWNFLFGNKEQILQLFSSLQTNVGLDETLASPYVFIIDRDKALRGRTDDEDAGTLYGFDATSVAELNNKMVDDVKIILAEYRLALKKNNAYREK